MSSPLGLQSTSKQNSMLGAHHNMGVLYAVASHQGLVFLLRANHPKHKTLPLFLPFLHFCHTRSPLLAPQSHPCIPEFLAHYRSISYAVYSLYSLSNSLHHPFCFFFSTCLGFVSYNFLICLLFFATSGIVTHFSQPAMRLQFIRANRK